MDDCCAPAAPSKNREQEKAPEKHTPWWRDRSVLIPAASGLILLIGLALEWLDLTSSTITLTLFWISLLLGGSQFVPNSIRWLLTSGKLSIGLLMTISAIGAVLLGYLEEAAALAFLYSIAEALEDRAMNKATSGLSSLLAIIPSTATVVSSCGSARTVAIEKLAVGDILRLSAGERLATDGVIKTGHSALDVSAIAGESIPIEVGPGDTVLAGSINTNGSLEIEATANGTDNSLTTVVELVKQAQHEKGERARIADRMAKPLVPGVLVLALLVGVIGSLFGDPDVWIQRALVVLVAASPCALGISVPVTVVSAIGAASKLGVIIKSGAAFERLGDIKHLALDKTGTLTRNHPTVAEVLTTQDLSRADVLNWAAALESHSTHPLATAITSAAPQLPDAQEVIESPGQGMSGVIGAMTISVGSPRWLSPGSLTEEVAVLEQQGMTVVIVHQDGNCVGAIGVRDELRPETPEVIQILSAQGIGTTMLTGDNVRTANTLARQAGIHDVRAQLRPEDKATAVAGLAERGPVAMVGDGINDTPALATADVGIAMGTAGSDAAIESADVAFIGDDLRLIPRVLEHARKGKRIINQNIILSLAIILILLPLAITGVLGLAAVVLIHELAEVVVIANGLRASRSASA
ncbi:heavy metal translocating P-type ATPase [Corynebacterium alimapuense]|uniref:Cadmium-translocating P-type ATPase n=1 Tax=Corynebacterium alimapuense TaxID=1576874 RepID=A0A3M8K6P1_9CORY|nr:cation-translocating P-type ATPase [Corynebacterium alimapuense]RNE48178.1 cadmium-translocating P-type ATPase [Corynebacterium alimapuense]